jgi:polyisoprenoid-binding protein YceI
MKGTRIVWLVACAAWFLARPAAAEKWAIDPGRSSARFSIRHLMIENVTGGFSRVSGTIDVDGKDVTRSRIEASIDATTIDTKDAGRDRHLRSADFLDVANFPEIRFASTKIRPVEPGRLEVSGNLTIRGATRPVTLDVRTSPDKDDGSGKRRAATATATIHRKDFGLVWNEVLETGGVAVGDDVTITLSIEAARSPA